MKIKTFYKLLLVLVTTTIIYAACTKEKSEVRLDPQLATTQSANIKSDSAIVTGLVIAGNGFSEKGVCWDITPAPTVDKNKAVTSSTDDKATYKVTLAGLKYATKYYVRAYAVNANGTIYGDDLTFTTLSVVPFLSTTVVSVITGTTATSGGNITDNGGEAVTARGVCWSINHNPTISDSKSTDDKGNGIFTSSLPNLLGKTTYYVRAYATNKIGTSYGTEVSFITLIAVPTVSTTIITNITAAGASSGGNITMDGGDVIIARGVCWSTSANPTIADSKTSDGVGKDVFTTTLAGLNVATLYHVRAFATNSAGVGYGNDVQFMTFPTAIYALGDGTTAGGDNTIAVKVNQSSTPGIYVGVLDLLAAKSLKFILTLGNWQPQWGQAAGAATGTLGINRGGGTDPDAITTPATAGKFKVTVDMSKMTYKIEPAFPTTLYMIGDGVGSWDWPTINLPMIPVNSHPNLFWKIVWMNATGGFKMAEVRDWGTDFGKTGSATAGVYDKGGENIPVPGTAGYYMVVVDLTTNKIAIADPKVYLIGNTIGSWDTANAAGLFTVDNSNSVVTITKTLVADEIRMYAWHPWFTDWWQSEFIILDGKIEFRGTGGDQARVKVTSASHSVNLNFKTGDGAIQ